MGWYHVEILELLDQGYSPEEIVAHYGQPEIVSIPYIQRIIRHRKHDTEPDVRATWRKPKSDPPNPGTQQYKVWEWVQKNIGSTELFKEMCRTKEINMSQLSREIHIPAHIIVNFKRDYTGNYRDRAVWYGNNKCLGQVQAEKNRRKWVPQSKRKKVKSAEQKLKELF